MKPKLRVTGVVLVAVAIVGFLTVADDLRHIGELIGVGSILVAGLLLFGLSFLSIWRHKGR